MKPNYILYIIAIASLTGCSKKAATEAETLPEISVSQPIMDSVILRQSYPARLVAHRSADVVARVNGTILQQLFHEGDFVTTGQPLYLIEASTYLNSVNQAEAALATAQAEKEYALRQSEAMNKAIEAEAVSRMDVIQAESNLRQAEASVKSAEAQLVTARNHLHHCTVTAPFSGKITKSRLDPGAYVNGADSPVTLATIYDDSTLQAEFAIETERYLAMADTRAGKKVDYTKIPVTFGDTIVGKYLGKLAYIAPDVSSTTGTVTLRIQLSNPKGELRNGMFATVELPYAYNPHALLIRDASISTDQLGKFVYIVNDSNKIVYTPIEVGPLINDTLRIVTEGLSPSDRYVTTALLKVRDGMKVNPIRN